MEEEKQREDDDEEEYAAKRTCKREREIKSSTNRRTLWIHTVSSAKFQNGLIDFEAKTTAKASVMLDQDFLLKGGTRKGSELTLPPYWSMGAGRTRPVT